MSKEREHEDETVAGIEISSRDMAELIADALIDGGVVKEENRAKCADIAAEEIWIRKLLVDVRPRNSSVALRTATYNVVEGFRGEADC